MSFKGAVENKRARFGDAGLSGRYADVEMKYVVRIRRIIGGGDTLRIQICEDLFYNIRYIRGYDAVGRNGFQVLFECL
jgi:hypothetical protein